MSYDVILHAFVTLLLTIDPPGNAPIFLGVTAGLSASERRQVAIRAALTSFAILALFSIAGSTILQTLGISIGAFRIAGGLLLFWIAFEMIFNRRNERKQEITKAVSKEEISNLAVFPLAIPIIAGPGSISAVVLLSSNQSSLSGHMTLLGLLFIVMALMLAAMLVAGGMNRFLGNVGQAVLIRLLGVLLAALSTQFVVDGIKSIWSA